MDSSNEYLKCVCEADDPVANVVFVHGLSGNQAETWHSGNDEKVFWPSWYHEEFERLAIYSLGYPASKFAKNEQDLFKRAMSSLDYIAARELADRPLVFVCHSLGGLLVKSLLRQAKEAIAASILRDDNKQQPEFMDAQNVAVDFADDAMLVDGDLNFAESSNVILKNACVLSLFLAAGEDCKFYHPRFALFDNIEDKGMQVERSHHFQRIIVERATELEVPYQVIFTTSMMNPDLELEDYVIGPHYTPDERSLAGLS